MPKYEYGCKGCEKTFVESHRIDDRRKPLEAPCSECGSELYIMIGASTVVSGVSVTDKRPQGWRDVLTKVHKSSGRKSTINT